MLFIFLFKPLTRNLICISLQHLLILHIEFIKLLDWILRYLVGIHIYDLKRRTLALPLNAYFL